MHKTSIIVIGACNLDIYATSSAVLIPADSNPGLVYTTPGGVGRNIAENLARLACNTKMLTALGQDAFADAIIRNAESSGIDLSDALRLPHFSTSVYVCINKPDGDIEVAVSDMDICKQISPDYLERYSDQLSNAALIVTETNLTQETLNYLCSRYQDKLCIDCVSVAKSKKTLSLLDGLYCLKANRGEAAAISGMSVTTEAEARLAAEQLHRAGVQLVIITLGEDGALISDRQQMLSMPLMPGETKNTSGCGDAFFAGAIVALSRQADLKHILRSGLAMSRLCAEACNAVSHEICPELLEKTIQNYQGGLWQ
ncbi:MAG: carbohydrate kinase family protein [Clostridia bacterium]|nr:carbohydrate kinase family protein [Clostridia bacterium]